MGLLRVLLAITVALVHFGGLFGFRMGSGAAAVEAFFVISGFYMYLVLHDKYYAAGIKSFYLARYLRLIPTYLVVTLLTLAALALTGAGTRIGLPLQQTWAYVSHADWLFQLYWVIANFTIFLADWQVFLAFDGHSASWAADFRVSSVEVYRTMLIPQGWSLGCEIWFYLIAPFALRSLPRMLLLITLSLAVQAYVLWAGLLWDPWAHRFTPSILHLFLFGSLACWAWTKWLSRCAWLPYLGGAGVVLLAAMLLAWHAIPMPEEGRRQLFVCLTILLVAPIFALTRTSKFDARVGELSYPIYVTHVLALLLAGWLLPGANAAILALALTLILSVALTYGVERPVDQWRKRFGRPSARSIGPHASQRDSKSSSSP